MVCYNYITLFRNDLLSIERKIYKMNNIILKLQQEHPWRSTRDSLARQLIDWAKETLSVGKFRMYAYYYDTLLHTKLIVYINGQITGTTLLQQYAYLQEIGVTFDDVDYSEIPNHI